MRDPKKPSEYTKEEIKNKIITSVLFFWLLGCCVIFVVGCVTYYYVGPIFGLEGNLGFQLTGLLLAFIIAHYSIKTFRFVGNVGREDYDEDEE